MATIRNIQKSLIGMEDLQQGVGTQIQTRADASFTVGKVDVPYAVNTITEMQDVIIERFTRARVYTGVAASTDYVFSVGDFTGITSNNDTSGTWILHNAVNTPQSFGAIGDGVTDDTAAVQAAMDAGSHVIISNGTFLVTSTINLNDGQLVTGNGTMKFGGITCFSSAGTVDQEVDLTVIISTHTEVISVTDGSLFSEGETVRLVSTIDCLSTDAGDFRLGRPTGSQVSYFTEFAEIQSISGNNITLATPTIFDNYPLIPGSTTPAGRQISVLQKMSLKRVQIDGLTFLRTASVGTATYIFFNENTIVKNCDFINQTFSGASNYVYHSYKCKSFNNTASLDASTQIKFGAVNPGAEDYFKFNFFLMVGANNCEMSSNQFFNGTQCLDISYIDAPSIRCRISDCNIVLARINILTTHNGSYENVIINNIGTSTGSGVSIRSRRDRLIGNYFAGAIGRYTNPATTTDTYGISIQDGYTQGVIIENNKVENYNWGFLMTDTSNYFAAKNFIVRGNDFTSCKQGIELGKTDGVGEFITTEMSGISMSNNTFRDIQFTACIHVNDPYFHGVDISENKFLDVSYDPGFYAIDTFENCKGFRVTNNVFPEIGRACRFKDITDTGLLGPNTLLNIGNFTSNNIKVTGSRDLTWVWGAGFIGNGGSMPTLLVREFEDITSLVTSFDTTSYNVLALGNSSGADITLDTLVGGYAGQVLYLSATTGAPTTQVFIASGGNINFPASVVSPVLLPTVGSIQLVMQNSTGGNWEFVIAP